MLKKEGKITDTVIENMLSWRHSGFHVYIGGRIFSEFLPFRVFPNPGSRLELIFSTLKGISGRVCVKSAYKILFTPFSIDQLAVWNRVKILRQIRINNICVAIAEQLVDHLDGIQSTAFWTIAECIWLKICLKDRLYNQFRSGLNNPVPYGGNPEWATPVRTNALMDYCGSRPRIRDGSPTLPRIPS